MRSRFRFWYPGLLWSARLRFLSARENLKSFSFVAAAVIQASSRAVIACGSIHQGHERFSDDSRGRQEIFTCLAALLYEQFLLIREWLSNGGAKISIKSYFMEIICFLSSELLEKNSSIRSKLPTAACWSREITEENLKQTCFMSKAKATSVP